MSRNGAGALSPLVLRGCRDGAGLECLWLSGRGGVFHLLLDMNDARGSRLLMVPEQIEGADSRQREEDGRHHDAVAAASPVTIIIIIEHGKSERERQAEVPAESVSAKIIPAGIGRAEIKSGECVPSPRF